MAHPCAIFHFVRFIPFQIWIRSINFIFTNEPQDGYKWYNDLWIGMGWLVTFSNELTLHFRVQRSHIIRLVGEWFFNFNIKNKYWYNALVSIAFHLIKFEICLIAMNVWMFRMYYWMSLKKNITHTCSQ